MNQTFKRYNDDDGSLLGIDIQVPGEEGIQWSDDADVEAMRLALYQAQGSVRSAKDERTWKERRQAQHNAWKPRMAALKTMYLKWKYKWQGKEDSDGAEDGPRSASEIPASEPIRATEKPSDQSSPTPQPQPNVQVRKVACIDLNTLQVQVDYEVASDQFPCEALAARGYLATTPSQPELAVSFDTLELFRTIKLFKPSFSTEAFAKMACYKYEMGYRRHYRTALGDAYDIYIEILEDVQRDVMSALGRDTPDWRAIHGCPPCGYELEDEEPTEWDKKLGMDGGNSLKRLARSTQDVADTHANEVPKRQDEVKARPVASALSDGSDADEPAPRSDPKDTEGDPTDGADGEPSPCATNWKAAEAEVKKHAYGAFEETGIFASCCRHGKMLWIADMVRSGEKAKYGLSIVNKINQCLPGRKLCGYDIGCVFEGTVARSTLGAVFRSSGSRFCCQLLHHPNIIKGAGIEDLEMLERVFSGSNSLASIVRYASGYRRHLLIVQYFRQWDYDKYTNLGRFLFNNFVQALRLVDAGELNLDLLLPRINVTRNDLANLAAEESAYFSTLRDEPGLDQSSVEYVEKLEYLRSLEDEYSRNRAHSIAQGPPLAFQAPETGPITDYNAQVKATRATESRSRVLLERIEAISMDITDYELTWEITRWQPSDLNYQSTLMYIKTRKYQKALGRLQRLVIQRLFELHKLNLAGTVRTHLSKSLQKRSKTIRTAIKAYNSAATAVGRPRIEWGDIGHYSFLSEFALLQGTANDIAGKVSWRRIARAREEIQAVYRESRRLHTHLRDEEILLILYGPVLEYAKRQRIANAINLAWVQHLHSHEKFAGHPRPEDAKAVAILNDAAFSGDLNNIWDAAWRMQEANVQVPTFRLYSIRKAGIPNGQTGIYVGLHW
ncbi:uncharacterized protein BXZ73DRAFT_90069 [Epithele typhae]|uniref:uncharacterized protein n=1 Tax=Epithele typhae TaxID=378194 RepID=UPI0020085BF9|nr:uncharacterized protein BXZ73DRAFT_90069 [Epithele typhae]KAH9931631.1 hypothetical protein BXZ73DRAFT_90069 [Epithele typhae]